MTGKQTIIDVTKCIHFNKSDITNGCTCYWDGECNHYCYYKQLKAKEQECEELKQTLSSIKNIAEEDFNHTCWKTYAGQLKQILQKISKCKVYKV